MQIGVFDSGLGGLALAQAIMRRLPEYDYLYLGDTKRVPYGTRSQETIHRFVAEALQYLFENDCNLVVLACNTASAEALRKSQQEYLPAHYPERRVLGVIIPTAEAVTAAIPEGRIGVLATASTVESGAYEREILRQAAKATVFQLAAPLLVPLIENDGLRYVDPVLTDYLSELDAASVEAIVLGCTHYSLLKDKIRALCDLPVFSQDEIVPEKLAEYLLRHSEIETKLEKTGRRRYAVTDITPTFRRLACSLTGSELEMERVSLD